MDRSKPIDLNARRAERAAALQKVMTPEQLRRRAVTKLRHNLSALADDQFEEAKRQLELVAVTDGPKAYVELYLKMLEFAIPKLSRAEVSVETDDSASVAEMTFEELQMLVQQGQAAREEQARTIDGDYSDLTGEDTSDL